MLFYNNVLEVRLKSWGHLFFILFANFKVQLRRSHLAYLILFKILILKLAPCGRGGTVGVGGNQCGVLYPRLTPGVCCFVPPLGTSY